MKMTQAVSIVEVSQKKYLEDYSSSDFTISTLDLEFNLYDEVVRVKAVSQVSRTQTNNTPMLLMGEQLLLISLSVNDLDYEDYLLTESGLQINNLPGDFKLEITTEINPVTNTSCEGLYKSGEIICTQCEAEGFRRITYYLDRPDVMAVFSTKIIADKAMYPSLLSNGNRVGQGNLENGRHWVSWVDPFPKPAYLFALVAGDFDCLRDTFTTQSGREVALEVFVDKGNLDRTAHAIQSLKKAMQWDEDRFNFEYDLDIYMIVAVDFFNMGAMENKGLNIFNSKFVLANSHSATDQDYLGIEAVISHEYFHNWTGNRITCRDWFQLSLKEGLTVFRDQEFSSDLGSRSANRIANVKIIRNHQFLEDAGPMSHPIRPVSMIEIKNFYTYTVYKKGAEVIRMIHTLLGEEKFQKGMLLYVELFDGKSVTCDDFVTAMQNASGVDLMLFKRWYSQSGTPLVNVIDHFEKRSGCYQITFKQKNYPTADQNEKCSLHIPIDIELLNAQGKALVLGDGKTSQILSFTQKEQTFTFNNVCARPVPSLFRGFSAPVKYHYAYSDQELQLVMSCASDQFAAWDAGQSLFNKYLIKNVNALRSSESLYLPESFTFSFKNVFSKHRCDPALVADMFDFISESGAMELFDCVDIDALHAVRNFMVKEIATDLKEEFMEAFERHQISGEYQPDALDIAKRKLANTALFYISKADSELGNKLVLKQVSDCNNMTDHLGALIAANSCQLECREQIMADFNDKWFEDSLVMDKWLVLQSTLPSIHVLDNIKALFNHSRFDFSNPNRLRALLGGFIQDNVCQFHAQDGSGYLFLTEQLIKLNEINPQVASGLITPLIQFKRLDKKRITLIKAQLNRLLALDNLSLELFEKVSKALEQ